MTIQLKPETAALFAECLFEGQYADADELVKASLMALVHGGADMDEAELLDACDRTDEDVCAGRCLTVDQVREQMRLASDRV